MNDLISKRDPWSFNWLAVTGLLVSIPHMTRIPPWLTIVFLTFMAWQWAAIQRGWRLPGRVTRLTITLVLLLAVFREFGTLLGRDAGTGLLIGLAGLKFLELRTLRDYTIIVFVLYMLVGVNFLYDQTILHGAYLLVAVLLTTATLVRLNLPTTNNWRYNFRLAGGMLVRAAPLMLVMYLLFPRIQGGLWSLPADAHSAKTGLSSRISAGSISRLVQSEAIAFRVEFDGSVPPPDKRYWRTIVLWHTDGKDWTQGQTPYLAQAKYNLKPEGNPVRYTVTLEPSGNYWRPSLDLPLMEPQSGRYRTGYLVEAKSAQNQRVRYTLSSSIRYSTGPLPEYERRLGLALERKPGAKVQSLVDSWRRKSNSNIGVVKMALAHFGSQNFRYTLKPPLLGDKPVEEFLFDTQAGFCEHYATTFVALMRLAGIPSRVVAGYQGGELNEGSGYLVVRQSDAHAWAEVWLPDSGWTRVDPTASVAPERIELGMDAIRRLGARGVEPGSLAGEALANLVRLGLVESLWRTSRQAIDSINLAWFRWTVGYDFDKQIQLLKRLGLKAPDWTGLIVGLVAGVGAFFLAMFLALNRSDRDHEPVQAVYKKFENKLAAVGFMRPASEGPMDFANRIKAEIPALRVPVTEITELYIRLRYGALDKDRVNDLATMRKQVRKFGPKRLLADTET